MWIGGSWDLSSMQMRCVSCQKLAYWIPWLCSHWAALGKPKSTSKRQKILVKELGALEWRWEGIETGT